jgi:hypothetical protein
MIHLLMRLLLLDHERQELNEYVYTKLELTRFALIAMDESPGSPFPSNEQASNDPETASGSA